MDDLSFDEKVVEKQLSSSKGEKEESSDEKAVPTFSRFIFFVLGDASLLAFNIAINAIDIYTPLFQKLNLNIGAAISRAYNIPSTAMAFIMIFWMPSNLRLAITIGLTILILVMCVIPILFSIHSISTEALYWGTVVIIGITGVFSSYLFSATYAFASQVGQSAGASASSGNGACGVVAAALRIITKLALNDDKGDISSIIYYVVAIIIYVISLIYFIIISRRSDINSCLHAKYENKMCSKQLFDTIKIIWVEWTSVAVNFVITLIIFPGYTTDIRQGKIGDWAFVLVTTIFCIFDWIGRAIPGYIIWPPRKYAWIPIAGRLVFFLVFMLSIQGIIDVGEPWWTICWQCPFALTNGYFGTVSLIYGSNHEKLDMNQRKQASFLISFAINAGILLAVLLTFVMPKGVHLDSDK